MFSILHITDLHRSQSDPISRTPSLLIRTRANVSLMLQIYQKEYAAFGHMAKDFVRITSYSPGWPHLVPSATRQGAQAFLQSLQRTRDIFEYEKSDLENLTSLWKDYLDGKISMTHAFTEGERAKSKLPDDRGRLDGLNTRGGCRT